MNLLRFRPVNRTLRVEGPQGARKVKITISDNQVVQHVEDDEVQHATAKPLAIGSKIKFQPDMNTGLWVPLPK